MKFVDTIDKVQDTFMMTKRQSVDKGLKRIAHRGTIKNNLNS